MRLLCTLSPWLEHIFRRLPPAQHNVTPRRPNRTMRDRLLLAALLFFRYGCWNRPLWSGTPFLCCTHSKSMISILSFWIYCSSSVLALEIAFLVICWRYKPFWNLWLSHEAFSRNVSFHDLLAKRSLNAIMTLPGRPINGCAKLFCTPLVWRGCAAPICSHLIFVTYLTLYVAQPLQAALALSCPIAVSFVCCMHSMSISQSETRSSSLNLLSHMHFLEQIVDGFGLAASPTLHLMRTFSKHNIL